MSIVPEAKVSEPETCVKAKQTKERRKCGGKVGKAGKAVAAPPMKTFSQRPKVFDADEAQTQLGHKYS